VDRQRGRMCQYTVIGRLGNTVIGILSVLYCDNAAMGFEIEQKLRRTCVLRGGGRD
jgi:hypothetical protein